MSAAPLRSLLLTLPLLAAAGCGAPGDLDSVAFALGEPTEDRPGYQERLALYATNRARVDPKATEWPEYPPTHPLLWSDALARSARAHSQDMRDTPCFQHNSCNGTDPFVRIKKYWTMPFASLGENIAAGVNDGERVVYNWINEIGAKPGETGHREAIFDYRGKSHYVGLGYLAGGTRYQGYWTQDFAAVNPPPAIPPLAGGSHFPAAASIGAKATFGTVYYDAKGTAPDFVEVVVDGTATPLALVRGKAAAGAYQGDVTITEGCHRYFFRTAVAGKRAAYPDAGTLGVASLEAADKCAEYSAGGVVLDPGMAPGGNPGGGGGGDFVYRGAAGCTVSPQPRGDPRLAALLALALAALLRRRR